MDDEEWTKILERLKAQAVQFRTVRLLARSICLGEPAVKAVLMGKKPTFMTQLRVEEWVKQRERMLKK